jgi:hypothetical protein
MFNAWFSKNYPFISTRHPLVYITQSDRSKLRNDDLGGNTVFDLPKTNFFAIYLLTPWGREPILALSTLISFGKSVSKENKAGPTWSSFHAPKLNWNKISILTFNESGLLEIYHYYNDTTLQSYVCSQL